MDITDHIQPTRVLVQAEASVQPIPWVCCVSLHGLEKLCLPDVLISTSAIGVDDLQPRRDFYLRHIRS